MNLTVLMLHSNKQNVKCCCRAVEAGSAGRCNMLLLLHAVHSRVVFSWYRMHDEGCSGFTLTVRVSDLCFTQSTACATGGKAA